MGRHKKPIVTIDCETDPFKKDRVPVPFLWGLYDGERFRHWDNAPDMLRYLMQMDVVVFAHNGGKFDYQFILDHLEPWTEVTIINNRLAKFMIGKAEFRDSWNILPAKLASFGNKKEIDITKLEPDVRAKHMEEIIRYNRQDCVGLYEAVMAFRETYGTGLTLAGSAMNYWAKHFNHDKPETDRAFYEEIAPFYSGGRVQCFHKGPIKRAFDAVDINSAYPYAMTHNHPISTHADECFPKASDKIIPQSLYTIAGISRGALPWKGADGALTFPNDGEGREYHITGWELQAALDTKRLGPWQMVKRLDFLKEINFTDYVSHFYDLKARSEKGSKEYTFAKLFMNSLYGKFGANPDAYRSYGVVPLKDKDGLENSPGVYLGKNCGPWRWSGMLGSHALMVGEDPVRVKGGHAGNPVESQYYNVATAASITGFVRAFLLRHIDRIEKAGGRVLYCDTDSLVFQDVAAGDVCDLGKKLGEWTHEGRFDHGAIAGKKLYAFHGLDGKWKTATKGVRIGPAEICRVAEGEEVTWESIVPSWDMHQKPKAGEARKPKFLKRRVRMT